MVSQFPSDTQFQIDLAETLAEMGSQLNTTGRSRDAEDNYREGVAILESLLTHSPADRDLKYKLIKSAVLPGPDHPAADAPQGNRNAGSTGRGRCRGTRGGRSQQP